MDMADLQRERGDNSGEDDMTSDKEQTEALVRTDHVPDKYLIYGVNDVPPVHVTILCALQVCTL